MYVISIAFLDRHTRRSVKFDDKSRLTKLIEDDIVYKREKKMEAKVAILDDISKGLKKGMQEAEKGIKQVGEKASDAVKTFEVQQEIDKLENEIRNIKIKIGTDFQPVAGRFDEVEGIFNCPLQRKL